MWIICIIWAYSYKVKENNCAVSDTKLTGSKWRTSRHLSISGPWRQNYIPFRGNFDHFFVHDRNASDNRGFIHSRTIDIVRFVKGVARVEPPCLFFDPPATIVSPTPPGVDLSPPRSLSLASLPNPRRESQTGVELTILRISALNPPVAYADSLIFWQIEPWCVIDYPDVLVLVNW